MRIVCAGLSTVDLIYRVDRMPGADEKAQAESAEVAAGGPALNAAVTAAALGAEVTLVTAVGAHPLGEVIRDDLRRRGVRLIDAGLPEAPPVSAVIVDAAGGRTIVSRNAAGVEVPVPPDLGLDLESADAVLVDGHHPALARAAASAGRPLVVDAGSWRPVFADVLPHATVVACSAAFPREKVSAPHVAVTHGPGPVQWWSGGRSGEIEVPPVTAVDTAGAGDAFHGALTVAVAQDPQVEDLSRALRYAVQVAGVRVQHAGPRAWLTYL